MGDTTGAPMARDGDTGFRSMTLDLPTLMVMQSFALSSAGVVVLFAWLQNRTVPAVGLWGLANILAGAGIFSLMLGVVLREPSWSVLGAALMTLQTGLVWKAARAIDSKPAPLVIALVGPVVVTLAYAAPVLRDVAGSLSLSLGAGYLIAAAWALWCGRQEHLTARWPLIILTVIQAASYLIDAYSTLTGETGQNGIPKIASVFGIIYFESIIFALGTSVFILALVKERNEAASITAARTDSLTGIANRATFRATAQRLLERCRRDAAPVAVMMFDLDRFKAINDRHGHAVGDAVIQKFCAVTAALLRPNDIFGRMGGEEFAVALPGSSIEAASVRAERIRASFAENCRFIGNHQVNATVSGGVSVSMNVEETLDALLELSDMALYSAKTDGRNRIKRADQPKPDGGLPNVFRVA
jgi:diguanylate cyclase (GGDEF)-like protein